MSCLHASRWLHGLIIVMSAAAVALPGLGSTSLWDIDEGLNAEAAREMLESGDWVVPYFNFKPRTAKPPLLYWLQAMAYRAFGVNEFAARLPSALAMMVAALMTYRLGRRMFSPAIGLLAALILLSTIQTSVLAHAATPDAVLLACFLLTFNLFWDGYAEGRGRWLWTTGLGCGLAALAKGPIGLLLPVGIVVYFLIAQRQLRALCDVRLFGGVLVVILVAGPWYALVGAETHGAFLRAFWQNDNVGRFVNSMEGHRGPFWYYLATLTVGLTPWSVFLIPTAWDTIRTVSSPQRLDRETAAVRFLMCWAAVYLAFFSLAQTKLPNYVLPVFPPVAILIARYLVRWQHDKSAAPAWFMPLGLALLAAIGAGVAIGAAVAGGQLWPNLIADRTIPGLAAWSAVGLIPAGGAALGWLALRRQRRGAAISALGLSAVAFLSVLAAGPVRCVDAQKAPRALVAASGAHQPGTEVRTASVGYFQPSLVFYCGREVTELMSVAAAIDFLNGPLPSFLFCPAELAPALLERSPGTVAVARRRDFYKGWDVVVLRNLAPPPLTRITASAARPSQASSLP